MKLKGLNAEEYNILIPSGTILLGYRGSIAHGTYVPKRDPDSIDDKDIMGIRVSPLECYLGLKKWEQREKQYKEWDSVVYDIKKMFSLLLKSNPNVLSQLFLDETSYIIKTELGQRILDARDIFVSRKAYYSFCGYAKGQAHRMTHSACEGYMGEKRKKLVAKFGYDCKNAAHLIRLLRMGIEFLKDGILYVRREHDATELIEIKRGEWTLDKVKTEADRLFGLAEEAFVRSPLPLAPDYDKANELLISIIKSYHNLKES